MFFDIYYLIIKKVPVRLHIAVKGRFLRKYRNSTKVCRVFGISRMLQRLLLITVFWRFCIFPWYRNKTCNGCGQVRHMGNVRVLPLCSLRLKHLLKTSGFGNIWHIRQGYEVFLMQYSVPYHILQMLPTRSYCGRGVVWKDSERSPLPQ